MEPQNAFQALMRRWTSLGAYNALHLLRVKGQPEQERWLRAAETVITPLGIKAPAVVGEVYGDLQSGITAELNKPFAAGESPLRFFVVQNAASADYHFGVTFDHWIADSQSVRLLMQRIFAEFQREGSSAQLTVLRLNTTPFYRQFGRPRWLKVMLECLRNYRRHRRAQRLVIYNALDFSVGFSHRQLPDGLIGRIQSHAKKLKAKVNDVFLAAATIALLKHIGPPPPGKRSRDCASMSVAMDIRPFAKAPVDDLFGFFLGYFSVIIEPAGSPSLDDIVAQISPQTQTAKSAERVLHLFPGFKLAELFWRVFNRPDRKALMFHRGIPTLGGISNVNLTDSWIAGDPSVLDYVRVSPAGPIVPIVFTLTTIKDRLSLCVTHRNTVFSPEQAARITAHFVEELARIPSA